MCLISLYILLLFLSRHRINAIPATEDEMTDEQWEEIRPLVEEKTKARARCEAWALTNSNQPTERERIEVSLGYRRALAEFSAASAALFRALAKIES